MAKEDGGWRMENGGGRWRWPTPDMLGYVSQPPAKGGVAHVSFPLDLAMFVANVCGFEFKLK